MGLGIALGAYTDEYNNQRKMRKDDEIHALKKEEFGWKKDEVEQEKSYKSKVAELANQSPLKGYQAELAQWEAAGGQGPQPQPPNAFQMLQFNSQLADVGLQFGKYDPRIAVENAKYFDHMKNEGYLKGVQMLRSGDVEGASQAFNSSGNERVDMSQATAVQVQHRGLDGKTKTVTAYQLPDGTVINPEQILESLIPIEKLARLSMESMKTDAYVANQGQRGTTGAGREPSTVEQLRQSYLSAGSQDELDEIAEQLALYGVNVAGKTDSEGNYTPGLHDMRSSRLRKNALMAKPDESEAPAPSSVAAPTESPEVAPPVVAPPPAARPPAVGPASARGRAQRRERVPPTEAEQLMAELARREESSPRGAVARASNTKRIEEIRAMLEAMQAE